jgi:hypothetical protein
MGPRACPTHDKISSQLEAVFAFVTLQHSGLPCETGRGDWGRLDRGDGRPLFRCRYPIPFCPISWESRRLIILKLKRSSAQYRNVPGTLQVVSDGPQATAIGVGVLCDCFVDSCPLVGLELSFIWAGRLSPRWDG